MVCALLPIFHAKELCQDKKMSRFLYSWLLRCNKFFCNAEKSKANVHQGHIDSHRMVKSDSSSECLIFEAHLFLYRPETHNDFSSENKKIRRILQIPIRKIVSFSQLKKPALLTKWGTECSKPKKGVLKSIRCILFT